MIYNNPEQFAQNLLDLNFAFKDIKNALAQRGKWVDYPVNFANTIRGFYIAPPAPPPPVPPPPVPPPPPAPNPVPTPESIYYSLISPVETNFPSYEAWPEYPESFMESDPRAFIARTESEEWSEAWLWRPKEDQYLHIEVAGQNFTNTADTPYGVAYLVIQNLNARFKYLEQQYFQHTDGLWYPGLPNKFSFASGILAKDVLGMEFFVLIGCRSKRYADNGYGGLVAEDAPWSYFILNIIHTGLLWSEDHNNETTGTATGTSVATSIIKYVVKADGESNGISYTTALIEQLEDQS